MTSVRVIRAAVPVTVHVTRSDADTAQVVRISDAQAARVERVSDGATMAEVLAGFVSGRTTGGTLTVTGPTLPTLTAGTEYVWNKTDGAGTLLDILSGVA